MYLLTSIQKYNIFHRSKNSTSVPEPGEIVTEGRLDDVVDVGDLPLQVRALADVALKREVMHLDTTHVEQRGKYV